MWNHDVSDTKEVERMAALYDEDGTRAVEPGAAVETFRPRYLDVRSLLEPRGGRDLV